MKEVIAGIDLGTSNSCMACFFNGKSEVILSRSGGRVTPSAVLFSAKRGLQVGEAAKRGALLEPQRAVLLSKRLIGRAFDSDEVQTIRSTLGYEIFAAPNGDAWIRVADREMSPVEVAAHVLESLKESGELFFNHPLTKAVIAVPAFFDETQRQASRDAAEIAGLHAVRIISEPTAAALAYGYSQNARRNVVIFDLGGGTFDVTVIAIEKGHFDVLSTDGDMLLGGADFDRLLALRFAEQIRETSGVDVLKDPMSRQRLVIEAERVKHDLSVFGFADSSLQYLTDGESAPINFEGRTNQAEYVALCAPLLDRLQEPCERALAQAGLSLAEIDDVVAVGGMTRSPAVQARINEFFGRAPLTRVNPDEAVAIGASIQSGIFSGQLPATTVVDVTPRGLGVRAANDKMSTLLAKSTPLPASVRKTFRATSAKAVSIEVLQGESPAASKNRRLGWIELPGFKPAPGQAYRIEFKVSDDGLLQVEAEVVDSGEKLTTSIRPSSGLARVQVERLRDEFAAARANRSRAPAKKAKVTFH